MKDQEKIIKDQDKKIKNLEQEVRNLSIKLKQVTKDTSRAKQQSRQNRFDISKLSSYLKNNQ